LGRILESNQAGSLLFGWCSGYIFCSIKRIWAEDKIEA